MMKTALAIAMTLAAAALLAGVARADEAVPVAPQADQPARAMTPEARRQCFADLSSYTWNPKADRPGVDSGDKFRAALAKCDDLLAIANQRAAMHEVHDHEAKVFARAQKFVIAAYGVLWVVLILFVVAIFLRQRKFNRMIADLEAKLRRVEGGGAVTGG